VGQSGKRWDGLSIAKESACEQQRDKGGMLNRKAGPPKI